MKYQPISCSIYDQIESFAVSKKKVKIVYTDNDSEEEIIHGVIENVYSENKAEYLTIMNTNIRLDFILTITEIKDK